MKNKLHPLYNSVQDESRCSGRSTTIALRIIAECIARPNEWVRVTDHVGGNSASLRATIQQIVRLLELKFFDVNGNSEYVRCNRLDLGIPESVYAPVFTPMPPPMPTQPGQRR